MFNYWTRRWRERVLIAHLGFAVRRVPRGSYLIFEIAGRQGKSAAIRGWYSPQKYGIIYAMKVIILFVALLMGGMRAVASEAAVSDREVWNEGVRFYEAGDVTNALRVLKPLMASKEFRGRAAEVVAKLEYEAGNQEDAAVAAQAALMAAPKDEKANRNFTRAVNGLGEVRETRHINEVLKASQGKDPGAMMGEAMEEARQLMAESVEYTTNEAVRAVAKADQLGARARKLADVWIPVKEAIVQSVTNEEQAATIVGEVEKAKEQAKCAAGALEDLDAAAAWDALSAVEHDCTRFHKLMVLPPGAVAADLVAQSNAWMDVEGVNGRSWQQDALDYTRAFRAKFPAWAKAYEQQAQADTNKEPFTAEAQAKISALATELEKAQLDCIEKELPPRQEEALEMLRQIQELLPKDKNGGGGQNQNQQQNQNQNQQGQQNQQSNQGQENNEQNNSSEQNEQQEPQQNEDEKSAAENEEDEKEDQEVEGILKKAQERNDEHEADKKARMRKAPLPPNERDW